MKELLNHLFENRTLDYESARAALTGIAEGRHPPAQISAFLAAFRMRSLTLEELRGFRSAMLELALPADLSGINAVDLCGTGGDRKNSFNISTLAAFVAAGAGQAVAKHGNYGITSICGSSNVLEHLGICFARDGAEARAQIEESGIAFLHAPLFHPAMKHVAPIRRELGVRTFFNILGPLVNPARPAAQLIGVMSPELARLYNYLLQPTDVRYTVACSLDGFDEISLTAPFKIYRRESERLMRARDIAMAELRPEDLSGGDTIGSAAAIFMEVLSGRGNPAQNSAVIANAAFALDTAQPARGLENCLEAARESLASGKAAAAFSKLKEFSHRSRS